MIRFMPDSWLDVVLRPLDMISPEGNIYVEVAAPDLRLAAAVLLAVAVLLTSARTHPQRRPVLQLLALTLLAMVPWFATSGNGRYFTPFLLLLGPLCIGLLRMLALSRFLKFSAGGLMLLLQAFLLVEASPVGAWSLASWRAAPYFQIAKPPPAAASYVTLSPISYSLIAPQFPAASRWLNASAPVVGRERQYEQAWLARATSLYLVVPTLPSQMDDHWQPSPGVRDLFNRLVADRGLSVNADAHCGFLASGGLANLAMHDGTAKDPQTAARFGFWLCPARYDPRAARASAPGERDAALEAVFNAVERLCPRFFPPGSAQTQDTVGGSARYYVDSDTRVYVLDDGEVLYKFWRSLNPVTIGTRADVVAGRAHVDCSKIRAPTWRSGGP
jgi:hypothetical protein